MLQGAGGERSQEGWRSPAFFGAVDFPQREGRAVRRWRDQVVELLSARAADLRLIVEAGLRRRESRGAHYRSDAPDTDDAWQRHLSLVRAPSP